MKRYRYILNGCVLGENKISDYRLLSVNNIKPSYNGESALRVNIPDDLKLKKWSCDSYSTTEDGRTIDELDTISLYGTKRKKDGLNIMSIKDLDPVIFR